MAWVRSKVNSYSPRQDLSSRLRNDSYNNEGGLDDSFTARLNKNLDRHPICMCFMFVFVCVLVSVCSTLMYTVFLRHNTWDSPTEERFDWDSYSHIPADVLKKLNLDTFQSWQMAVLTGIGATLVSWLIVYCDSAEPGISPPSPCAEERYRRLSGHAIHLNYMMGIINGICIMIGYLYW